jgi:membrane protein involved in colicin uptake
MDILPEIIEKEVIEENVIDEEEDALPDPEPKLKISKEEVFKDEPELITPQTIVADTPVVKKTKRTRKMSEEALKKLAEAREKAHQKRKENAELRRQGKLKTKKQLKEEKQQEEIENKRPVVNNITHKTENITNNITEEDIKRIALETSSKATKQALEGYEAVRKARKEEKRKAREEASEKAKIHSKILKASGYKMGDEGFFGNCF